MGGPSELATHHQIREAVFVTEQALFSSTDRDLVDDRAETLHVLGYVDGAPVGTVRLYPIAPELPGEVLWKGDRLAVLAAYRQAGLGAPLVRFAVAGATRLGGDRMVAHVQLENVVFFRRLGWDPVGDPAPYVGVEHQKMSIGLR
ncbi:MAG TPA: MSMEG_0567/Sll0786 family nitrogen starvation N-acetyltransferase [Actinomycetes bacterium]|nr:MSMEG_0567/Sll0786 family nitrogen starvation N-acetyltransferase [Actinomycetes bacterium]